MPQIVGQIVERRVIVSGENCDCKLADRNVQPFRAGQKFKTELNGLFLKIIAERPVAEHFEKGQVNRIADFLDITGTDAFLHIDQTAAQRMFLALEKRHQRMHAGGGEQTGGVIVRYQRSALDDFMLFADKKINVFFT